MHKANKKRNLGIALIGVVLLSASGLVACSKNKQDSKAANVTPPPAATPPAANPTACQSSVAVLDPTAVQVYAYDLFRGRAGTFQLETVYQKHDWFRYYGGEIKVAGDTRVEFSADHTSVKVTQNSICPELTGPALDTNEPSAAHAVVPVFISHDMIYSGLKSFLFTWVNMKAANSAEMTYQWRQAESSLMSWLWHMTYPIPGSTAELWLTQKPDKSEWLDIIYDLGPYGQSYPGERTTYFRATYRFVPSSFAANSIE